MAGVSSPVLVLASVTLALGGCGPPPAGGSPGADDLSGSGRAQETIGPVTDELLRAGHLGNPATWPTYGGDWAQTRFSPLDEIDRDNVHRLRPAWIHQTGINGSMETTPVVLGQEMYVTTPAETGRQEVLRLDATTGEVVWRVVMEGEEEGEAAAAKDLHLPTDFGPHRGVAVYGNRVYLGTLNGTLLALDRESGRRVFEVETLSPRITGVPLAARGRIILGLSWTERGIVQAFDAETGEHVWAWYAIPSSEEGGWWGEWAERLPHRPEIDLGRDIAAEKADSGRLADTWREGGAAAPMTPAFDDARGLAFVSTGAPTPTASRLRPSPTPATCGGRTPSARCGSRAGKRTGAISSCPTTCGAPPGPRLRSSSGSGVTVPTGTRSGGSRVSGTSTSGRPTMASFSGSRTTTSRCREPGGTARA